MEWFCSCENPECDWIHNHYERRLWLKGKSWNRKETMSIPKAVLALLCPCDDWQCDRPHTLQELQKSISATEYEALMATEPKAEPAKCPKCGQSDLTSSYVFQGKVEAYCSQPGCCVNFNIETGTIIDDDIQMELDAEAGSDAIGTTMPLEEAIIETNQTPAPKSHKMTWKDQLWSCDSCKFETAFLQEMEKHERDNVVLGANAPHYVSFKSKDRWECRYCTAFFPAFDKAAQEHENAEGKRLNQGWVNNNTSYKHCEHKPTHVIDGGDEGWGVWAGRKWDCENKLKDFDVVLNLSGTSVGRKHSIPFPELKQWEHENGVQEISLDWPDRGVVKLPKQFWKALLALLKKNKWKMVVFCIGGHGRTGTAIASMFVTEFPKYAKNPAAACKWVWDNYCKEAIETDSQIDYVYGLCGKKYEPPKKEEPNQKNQTQTISATSAAATQTTLDKPGWWKIDKEYD